MQGGSLIIKNSRLYDVLKWLALIGLPALGTLYFALAGIWGLPAAEQVVGTIVSVDTFLGVVLGISTSNYSSERIGDIEVGESPGGGKTFTLALDNDQSIEKIHDTDEVRFDVKKKPEGTTFSKGENGLSLVEALVVLLIAAVLVIIFFGIR
jgi:hypothetical protein